MPNAHVPAMAVLPRNLNLRWLDHSFELPLLAFLLDRLSATLFYLIVSTCPLVRIVFFAARSPSQLLMYQSRCSSVFQSVSHPQTTPESSLVPSRPATPLHRTAWRGISSLPPEILQEIYLNHPGYQHEMEWPLTASRHPCIEGQECQSLCWLAVSRVCRQWREVALNDPFLWSTLHIPIPYFPRLQTRRGAPSCAITDADMGKADGRKESRCRRMAQSR